MYPYTKKYITILILMDIISRIKGKYKNGDINNYLLLYKKIMNTISNPRKYFNVNTEDAQTTLSRNIYNYLREYNIIDSEIIGKYILII
ncbi:hypothetical protein IC006_0474 [Sulfuracidifex tepidarius]|uniref:Uncharacterized protein n=1 Tax=Sulfuracidifex tepidarius TaxID=1294262 RepID=A0A510DST4_9CREN|nr:hypothetical protein IC006_0474 [Sulfuracidifex tepidarius]